MDFAKSFAAFMLVCLSCSPNASAHPRGPSARYSVSVHDEYGRELRTFHHGGQTFVLGDYGSRYTIRVENRTAVRVEAVVSVDGRDVVSGQIGDFVRQRGYLIEPYDQVTIEGFRQSLSEVAAFRFVNPEASYSARMGTPQNVGVIGVAVFPERTREMIARPRPRIAQPRPTAPSGPYRRYQPHDYGKGRASSGAPAPAERSAAEPSSRGDRKAYGGAAESEAYMPSPGPTTDNLGTEYGESMYSSAQEIPFRRAHATQPAALITLRYDDRSGLLARGILIDPPPPPPPPRMPCGPEAFPYSRFAPPPPPGVYCGD